MQIRVGRVNNGAQQLFPERRFFAHLFLQGRPAFAMLGVLHNVHP
jgi:hypothetical protein